MKEKYERLMPGKNSFIPGFEVTSYFPDPIEISFVGSGISFTPGVPTEDGWYVVKVTDPRGEYYAIAQTLHGILVSIAPDIDGEHEILSHAKLPEL